MNKISLFFLIKLYYSTGANYFRKKERVSLSKPGKALRNQRNGHVCQIQLAITLVS